MEPSLLDRLPHRPPFRFLTQVEEIDPGRAGAAVWRLTGDEPFFAGHFPGEPVVPGVLIAEALAQLSGLVGFVGAGGGRPARGRLAHTDVRFDAPVVPPATVRLRSTLERTFGILRQFRVEARAGDAVAARGFLVLAALGGST